MDLANRFFALCESQKLGKAACMNQPTVSRRPEFETCQPPLPTPKKNKTLVIYVADVFPFYPPAVQAAAANRRKRQRKPGPSTPSPTRGWQLAAAAPHTKPKMDPPRHQQQSGPAPLQRPANGWATARSPSLLPTRRVFRVIRWSVSSGGVVEVTWCVCDQLHLWLWCVASCLISCQWGQLMAWSECLPVCVRHSDEKTVWSVLEVISS